MVHMVDNSSSLGLPSPFSPYLRSHCDRPMSTGKRPRSPDATEGYGDRPLKRPTLAFGEFNRRQLSHSSASSSRQGSEDWVQRAGGLTIDSPVYTPGESHYPFLPQDAGALARGLGEGDIDMAMESEEPENRMEDSQEREVTHLPQPPSVSSHLANVSYQQQPQQYHGGPHTPHRHPYPTRYSERKQSSIIPLIDVVPATPEHMHPLRQQFQVDASNDSYPKPDSTSTNPSFSPAPMAISPPTSFAQLASPTKKRVVFGPRANCEKCRLGVPGHFIHYE